MRKSTREERAAKPQGTRAVSLAVRGSEERRTTARGLCRDICSSGVDMPKGFKKIIEKYDLVKRAVEEH